MFIPWCRSPTDINAFPSLDLKTITTELFLSDDQITKKNESKIEDFCFNLINAYIAESFVGKLVK